MDKKLLIKYSVALVAFTLAVLKLFKDLGQLQCMFSELIGIDAGDGQEEW